MTAQEAVLIKILNCGTADLSLLDDIDYDLDDIIDDCIVNDDLSLHGIFRGVFYKAASALQAAFDEKKDEIRDDILDALEQEKTDFVLSGEMTEEELEEDAEHKELIYHLQLIESGALNPEDDMDYFLNYCDTHVSMKHIAFYRRWMKTDVDNIESDMGWTFEDND